jgi:hypothetical protein
MRKMDVRGRQFYFPANVHFTLAILAMVLTLGACDLEKLQEQERKAEADLKGICEPLSIPGAAVLKTEIHRGIQKVVIFKRHGSNISCDAVGQHFRTYFTELGWDPNRMTVNHTGFDFRKEDYLVSVECEAGKHENAVKKIIVSCSWGLR